MQNIEEIYKKYSKIVYKYIFCLTGNEEITEEIVQETFLEAVKNIDKFKGECKISTWLCQIAKCIWYKMLRSTKNIISLEEVKDIVYTEKNIEDQICQKEDRISLLKKIQEFDEDTRNVIYLRVLGNLEYNEIAEIMNKTANWARVTFFRGKQK